VADVTQQSLAEVARSIESREVSPVEVTEACLKRISLTDETLNSFITVMADEARRAAALAADEIASGTYRGPLHGVPIGLKDLVAVSGVRMTAGSKIMTDNIAGEDAEIVQRFRAAGAVIIGKLNMHEFAYGATGINPHYGSARNPWNTERITGGSSSGSGSAVASGQCFVAIGTDTGGSIRIPASLCGVVGVKPTFGLVSRRGIVPLSWSLDHAGPLARTVEDAAIVLQAIAGHDPLDDSSVDEPVPDYRTGLRDGVRGLRVGVPDSFFFDGLEDEVEAAVRAAIETLEVEGAVVSSISLPRIDEIPNAVTAMMLPEPLAYHQKWLNERPDDYGESVRFRLELAAAIPAVAYVQAQRFREMVVQDWREQVFSKVDVLACPTTAVSAPAIDESELSTTFNLIRLTNPLNLIGTPCVSLPCGFTEAGSPIGLQLVGRWFDEATLLRAAFAYEQATEWHKRRPAVG
jgi:aspartyl-tRNA(Asn)/glutamyl-tRNA(Gln) amidotransferase subunit A